MFYRVRADLPFTDLDEANDFFHDCELALPKAQTINPGTETEEEGHIIIEKCYHDQTPTIPCEPIHEDFTDQCHGNEDKNSHRLLYSVRPQINL